MITKKILVIDEDKSVCRQLCQALQDDTTAVLLAASAEAGWKQFAKHKFDLIIMDIHFSTANGLSILKAMRRQAWTPILVLSANASKEEEINALMAGADKFLGKPLDLEKCLAHAQAIMRRYMLDAQRGRSYILASSIGLEIDIRRHRVFLNGQPMDLTRKQFEMLCYLADHSGEVVTKDQIYQQIWNGVYDLNVDEAIKTQIKRLRQQLEQAGGKGLIETVWGVGYRLNA